MEVAESWCGSTAKAIRSIASVCSVSCSRWAWKAWRLALRRVGRIYLLRDLVIDRPNQVWCTDVTYLPMPRGFLFLVAILDWYSRYVVAWMVSNTQDTAFCLAALEHALILGCPEIFNSDQGCQFTSTAFTARLKAAGIKISMDGRGRVFDNIFIERLWRTVKYEYIYLTDQQDGVDLERGLTIYFRFYNTERPHQALGYQTPEAVHFAKSPMA